MEEYIRIRCDAELKEKVRYLAEQERISNISEYIRRLILKEYDKKKE
ncbi:MAG: Ribbon-helix-helix protein, copG family [bacterium ADurb.Bin157]|nr:MAG: Ribbon-helix-helix protein, copG family [bacterium ADurb.Bin157]